MKLQYKPGGKWSQTNFHGLRFLPPPQTHTNKPAYKKGKVVVKPLFCGHGTFFSLRGTFPAKQPFGGHRPIVCGARFKSGQSNKCIFYLGTVGFSLHPHRNTSVSSIQVTLRHEISRTHSSHTKSLMEVVKQSWWGKRFVAEEGLWLQESPHHPCKLYENNRKRLSLVLYFHWFSLTPKLHDSNLVDMCTDFTFFFLRTYILNPDMQNILERNVKEEL